MRLLRAGVTLLLVAVIAWLCLEAAPGAPAVRAARAAGRLVDGPGRTVPEALRKRIVDEVAREDGLDRPALARLGAFLGGLARGDLGRSWRDGGAVGPRVARALPTTLALTLWALVAAYLLGVAAALVAASRPHGWRDRLTAVSGSIVLCAPQAFVAPLAVRALGVSGGPDGMAVAACVLAYAAAALVALHGRAALLTPAPALVAALRARGTPPARELAVHRLALAAVPLVALAGVLLPWLLGASVVVERAFDLHGLGALLVDAAQAGDAPVVLGGTVAMAAVVVLGSLLVDALTAAVDPRA